MLGSEGETSMKNNLKKIGLIMGSINDYEKVEPAVDLCKEMGVDCMAHVYSAHRTPEALQEFLAKEEDNLGVIIAAAGKAAHLAGVIASKTTLPVIGIPIKSSTLDGLDALLSTVQMPKGIPVATVAIDGAYNAVMLALQILALSDDELSDKLTKKRSDMKRDVLKANDELQGLVGNNNGRIKF